MQLILQHRHRREYIDGGNVGSANVGGGGVF
jgi:hypothetical protein